MKLKNYHLQIQQGSSNLLLSYNVHPDLTISGL
jgi:hypothetical protein